MLHFELTNVGLLIKIIVFVEVETFRSIKNLRVYLDTEFLTGVQETAIMMATCISPYVIYNLYDFTL